MSFCSSIMDQHQEEEEQRFGCFNRKMFCVSEKHSFIDSISFLRLDDCGDEVAHGGDNDTFQRAALWVN